MQKESLHLFSDFEALCPIVTPLASLPLPPPLSVLFEAKNFSRWNVCSITNQENVFRSSGFSHFTKYVTFKLFVAWVPIQLLLWALPDDGSETLKEFPQFLDHQKEVETSQA